MNRLLGIVVLVVGVVLICWGYRESESVASGFSRVFSGSPTDKAMYLMIGGGVLSLVGAGIIFKGAKKKKS